MSDIEEVKEALAELLDLQINGKLSQFYEKYLQVYAALPLIRAAALEEAAQVAEDYGELTLANKYQIAAAIRILMEMKADYHQLPESQ